MKITAEIYRIALRRPFRVAHGSSDFRETILVRLAAAGASIEAFGEGALVPYYPSRAEPCLAWLAALGELPEHTPPAALMARLPAASPETAAARVALEIALHDFWSQKSGLPLGGLWNLLPETAPPGAWTISLANSEGDFQDMLEEAIAAGRRHFKIKAGGGNPDWDEACVRRVRERLPEAEISVDANAGWSPEEAAHLIPRLMAWSVQLVEQPTWKEWEAWQELRARLGKISCPPLVADESIQSVADLAHFAGLLDGVNIKLLKAGGVSDAVAWAHEARRLGLRVMIGVMVETGIGRTAAAHLAPLADWLDIDAPESIPAAPRSGFRFDGDRLSLQSGPGLGLSRL